MKNILFLHSSSELYGSDRSLLNLLKNIDRNEFNISVILPCKGSLVNEIKKIDNIDIIIKEIAVLRRKNLSIKGIFSYILDFCKSVKFLTTIIKKNNIDIVYTNTSVVFPGGITAKFLGKKSIWHVREIINNNFERKIVSLIVNLFSDIIIANSKATGDAITDNKQKIRIVYNAVESTPEELIRNRYNIENEIVIGMAGRINRWKGQKLFVDNAERVLQKVDNVKFAIAGDVYTGEDYILEDLKNYIQEKNITNKIEFLGQVEDMNEFYNNIDIFILPSIQPEPFGLVVIEAMDREIPVIATNHGGPTEIIENEKDGYLVDYHDCTEMSNITLELINNKCLRKQIGKKAKDKKDKMFNMDRYVEQISNILAEE